MRQQLSPYLVSLTLLLIFKLSTITPLPTQAQTTPTNQNTSSP